jgi:hypothetical protein
MVHIPPELPEASPIIISESRTHVVIALEIRKTTLLRNVRFFGNADRRCGPRAG